MILSIAYSRYFSTATPVQNGSTAKPSGLMTSLTAMSQADGPPGVNTARNKQTTKTTAPL
jgi:hypothetical protein